LVPPPGGGRRNAVYNEEHLLRLRLVRLLKERTHLRLEGIRRLTAPLSLQQLRDHVAGIEGGRVPELDSDEELIVGLAAAGPEMETMSDAAEYSDAELALSTGEIPGDDDVPVHDRAIMTALGGEFDDGAPVVRSKLAHLTGGLVSRLLDRGEPMASLDTPTPWERVRITDDLEIHYRGDAGGVFTSKLKHLLDIARAIFRK